MVFAGELGRQMAASQQKLRAIRQRPTQEIAGWTAHSPTSFFKKPTCLFQLNRVGKTRDIWDVFGHKHSNSLQLFRKEINLLK